MVGWIMREEIAAVNGAAFALGIPDACDIDQKWFSCYVVPVRSGENAKRKGKAHDLYHRTEVAMTIL